MGMHDLFEIDERAADSVASWCKAALAAAALAVAFFSGVDAIDSLTSSSPGFAVKQWARHWAGDYQPGEIEAKELFKFAAEQSGLPAIGWARVWASDRVGEGGADGMFDPVVFKVTLGERFAESATYEQRWLIFHESGHIAAMLTSRLEPGPLPSWGLSREASRAMQSSILYQQAYAESFADVFAAAMSLRVDWRDPKARERVKSAMARRLDSVSIAHDTQPALSLAAERLEDLTTLRGARLLALVDSIASQGAVATVGEWGAEREALCLEGWRGRRRWARDGAHEYVSNPWRMASADAPAGGEPMGAALSELMALTPGRGWLRSRAELAWGSYAGRAAALGAEPKGSAPAWFADPAAARRAAEDPALSRERAWASALADYEPGARGLARSLLGPPFAAVAWLSGAPKPAGCASD